MGARRVYLHVRQPEFDLILAMELAEGMPSSMMLTKVNAAGIKSKARLSEIEKPTDLSNYEARRISPNEGADWLRLQMMSRSQCGLALMPEVSSLFSIELDFSLGIHFYTLIIPYSDALLSYQNSLATIHIALNRCLHHWLARLYPHESHQD